MKIMAVDLGDARTGLAICDPSESLASPIGVIHEKNASQILAKVADAAVQNRAELVVVGHPINMDSTLGERAEKSRLFAQELAQLTDLAVHLWDERSTTVSATYYLNQTNTRGKKRKNVVDAVAATIILENYLAWRKNHPDPTEPEPPTAKP